MTCCGNKRRAAVETQVPSHAPVEFMYRGSTSLTAVGGVTGRLYWFEGRGARVRIHPRDATSLDGVPNLMRTQSS